jgi:hypothetical protein
MVFQIHDHENRHCSLLCWEEVGTLNHNLVIDGIRAKRRVCYIISTDPKQSPDVGTTAVQDWFCLGFKSSGKWCHVIRREIHDVSKDHVAFILQR